MRSVMIVLLLDSLFILCMGGRFVGGFVNSCNYKPAYVVIVAYV